MKKVAKKAVKKGGGGRNGAKLGAGAGKVTASKKVAGPVSGAWKDKPPIEIPVIPLTGIEANMMLRQKLLDEMQQYKDLLEHKIPGRGLEVMEMALGVAVDACMDIVKRVMG